MPDLERLIRFVNEAPAGTMIPVDSLRELLAEDTLEAAPDEERRITPAELRSGCIGTSAAGSEAPPPSGR